MNIFEHIRLLKIIKLLLLLPFIGIALIHPSAFTGGICFAMFIIILFDFIVIDKASDDYHRLHRSAYYDALTGIPNRLNADLFVEKLVLPSDLSVITADLDGLKKMNDTMGHLAGDILIRNFARIFFRPLYPTALPHATAAMSFWLFFFMMETVQKRSNTVRNWSRL